MKSRRITCNTVNQDYALNFKIYHEWIFNRKDNFNEKHLKKFDSETRNQSRYKRARKSFQKRENDSLNEFDCILYKCCIRFEDKVSTTSCVLYHDSRTAYKTWNLEFEMSINDAKFYAIKKIAKWSKTLQNFNHRWIFTNNQNAIRCIKKFTHFLANEIYETVENLTNTQTHIHWILEYADISKNQKANCFAKSVFSSNIITRDRYLSFKFLNDQITKHNR
jgi:hypothetical protein